MKLPYKREPKQAQGPTKCAGAMTMIIMAWNQRRTLKKSCHATEAEDGIRESAKFQFRERGGGYTKGSELKLDIIYKMNL